MSNQQGPVGFSIINEIDKMQAHGPLAYTTYDVLKHFAGVASIVKFGAHVFSLPVMVFLRRDFGMRYVDEIHITLAFAIWQMIGLFSFGGGELLGQVSTPLISLVGWVFLPVALWHRRRAKKAALQGIGYSYYPGMPRLVPLARKAIDWCTRRMGRLPGKIPRFLVNLAERITPAMLQGFVRRFVEPTVVMMAAMFIAGSGINTAFGLFLMWTAILLWIDESFAQRAAWEAFLDQVDARVLAEERERVLSGKPATGSAGGFSMAGLADLRPLGQRMQQDGANDDAPQKGALP